MHRWTSPRAGDREQFGARSGGSHRADPTRASCGRTGRADDARRIDSVWDCIRPEFLRHSYLVLAYSESDRVSLSVGFYYMANAEGRLLGTLLSGLLYQLSGVGASLWGAVVLAAIAGFVALALPPVTTAAVSWAGVEGDD
jgi:hypothetical protein